MVWDLKLLSGLGQEDTGRDGTGILAVAAGWHGTGAMAAPKKKSGEKRHTRGEKEPLINQDRSRLMQVWDGFWYLALCECFSCSCLFVEGGKLKPASHDPFT